MPKISPSVQAPAQIKAKTNFNPTVVQAAPTETKEVPKTPGQENTIEGVTPEAKPLPPQYEALAKKESALHARETELKAQEASFEGRIKAAIDAELGKYRERLKKAPLDVLNEEGLTYDELVQHALNQPDPKTRALDQRLESIEANQKRQEESAQKAADEQRANAIKQIKFDIEELVETDTSFETIKATKAIDKVVDRIVKTFDESGKLLKVEQAAKMIEDELFEEAIKLASLGKVKAKLAPTLTTELVDQTKQSTEQKPQATTLTNQMTSNRPMNARERAIARFKGEQF